MRKSINGLCQIVQNSFNLDPFTSQMFVFCNRSRNRLKILQWDTNGFWLHFKRIERGSFKWPSESDENITMNLNFDELLNLINAPGLEQKLKRKELFI
ncbi:MAG: IS66 family insertion sequence element accessory protein TnpB [Malacoplasma sp.]